jgi:hypothetical protein
MAIGGEPVTRCHFGAESIGAIFAVEGVEETTYDFQRVRGLATGGPARVGKHSPDGITRMNGGHALLA